MNNIIALAVASLIASAAFGPVATAQESEGKFMFRYNSTGGSGATKPDDEENNDSLALSHSPALFTSSDFRGNQVQRNYVEIFGNGSYAATANVSLFLTGTKDTPNITFNAPGNLLGPMYMDDASPYGINGGAHYAIAALELPYSFNSNSITVTADVDGKRVTTNVPLTVRRYNHGTLRFDTSNFSSVIDTTVAGDGRSDSNYLTVIGGIPPYQASVSLISGNNIPNNSAGMLSDFNSSNISDILIRETSSAFETYEASGITSQISAQVSPIVIWGSCSGNEEETSTSTSETTYSITITDSAGAEITSPTQRIVYFNQRPSCGISWGLPR